MTTQFQRKGEEIKDITNRLANFWVYDNKIHWRGYIDASQRETVNDAYKVLRSDAVERYSKEDFLPQVELIKNKMIAVQSLVRECVVNPNIGEEDRAIALQKQIHCQRVLLGKLRTGYLSDIFIGPRISLANKILFMDATEDLTISQAMFGGHRLHPEWIEKLEMLFPNDYGIWIAQTDERTRLDFKQLASGIKNALGDPKYKDFQATIELLSNNKEGGMDNWWPAATQ
jgi:hypothetical protein